MPDGSPVPVKGARPSVEFDGQRDATLSASLLALDIVDTVDGLANCELLFGNWGGPEKGGFQHFDRKVLEFGKAIIVRLRSDALFEVASARSPRTTRMAARRKSEFVRRTGCRICA
jgi:hypothetical protein